MCVVPVNEARKLMEMFEIGVITKAQGIKGEVRIHPITDDPNRFSLLIGQEVFLKQGEKSTPYKLTHARVQKGAVIAKLDSINDRNAAELLIRGVITIPPEKALPLEDDEYYVRDLIGLNVETESGEGLGIIAQVLNTNANDVYVIEPLEGDSFMIPAIKDVVLNVSMAEKKITVRLMEGLRELKA